MQALDTKDKTYFLDDDGFLVNPTEWDEGFAEKMAMRLGIPDGLTRSHWNVLKYIRAAYLKTGLCPIVLKTCKDNNLSIAKLEKLFPTGYQRGACKLAGCVLYGGWGMHPGFSCAGGHNWTDSGQQTRLPCECARFPYRPW